MGEHDDIVQRVAMTLKEPVEMNPALDRRVMAEVEHLPAPSRLGGGSLLRWFREPRTFRASPLAGLAAAAAIAALGIGLGRWVRPSEPEPMTPTAALGAPSLSTVDFVLVAPAAASVAVVGDFNDWDLDATPLTRAEGDGMWSVVVPLAPGRYRYSFVVDGTIWRQDPSGTPAVADEFGRPNSVVTIGGIS